MSERAGDFAFATEPSVRSFVFNPIMSIRNSFHLFAIGRLIFMVAFVGCSAGDAYLFDLFEAVNPEMISQGQPPSMLVYR